MNISGCVIKKDSELVAGRLETKFESGRFSQSGSTFETMNPLKEGWVGWTARAQSVNEARWVGYVHQMIAI